MKQNELVAKYSYDVFGRRLSKETKDQVKKYIYSSNDAIQEDQYTKKDGKLELKETKENIYSNNIDDIIATVVEKYEDGKIKETKTYYYHKNQLGSITALTDESGKTIEEYRYDVFGQAYLRNGKSDNWREFTESKVGNTRLFTGREYDKEIGLYYYRARYYSTELGRFISRDPIGLRDDVNLYGYVGNRVVGFVDPMGREKVLLAINESSKIYAQIINGGLGGKSEYSFYGGFLKEELTSSEYGLYKNEMSLYSIKKLDNNRILASSNDDYVGALDATMNDKFYKFLAELFPGRDEMFNALGWDEGNNTYADALRHTYFNALNAKDFGIDIAKKIGDYHEMLDGNYGHTVIMDLYNNSIGRSIGLEYKDKSDAEILKAVINNRDKIIFGYGGTNGYWQGNQTYNNVVSKIRGQVEDTLSRCLSDNFF